MSDNQDIKITGQPTLDPQVCKFTVDRPLLESGAFNCRDKEKAESSPLLKALFAIDGIAQVHVAGDTLTIAKGNEEAWQILGKQIGAVVREQVTSGVELIDLTALNGTPAEEEIRQKIEKLFEESINPQIASHGGVVELADVSGTVVSVRLGGGCQGCGSANATLKQGIEVAIREIVPEVTEVRDATDHASGVNPYM